MMGKAFGSSKQPAIHRPDKLSTPDKESIIKSPATALPSCWSTECEIIS